MADQGSRDPFRAFADRLQANAPSAVGPGKVLGGRYELVRELGDGAFGVVYEGVDRETGAQVAVKVLHENLTGEEMRVRLAREAHVMRQLEGTAVVAAFDVQATETGRLFMVMEYLEGCDLEIYAAAMESMGEPVSLRDIGVLLRPIVDTLAIAHPKGIIHRDLKPENIFVLDDGATRLLDFGLVKDLNLRQLTAVGTIAGSPMYIAPESWHGDPSRLDHRVDVYALGVIVFRLLTGVGPFEEANGILHLSLQATTAPRPSPRSWRPTLDASVDAWTERALAIEPDDRFASIWELWEALGNVFARST